MAAAEEQRKSACARVEGLEAAAAREASAKDAAAEAADAAAAAAKSAAEEQAAELEEVRRNAASALEREQVCCYLVVPRVVALRWRGGGGTKGWSHSFCFLFLHPTVRA